MTTKVNILFDGGFFYVKFNEKYKKAPSAKDVVKEVEKIMSLVREKTGTDTEDILFRVYYYDCKPFGGNVTKYNGNEKIDYSESPLFKKKETFLHELSLSEKFAVRLGELSFDGWKHDRHNVKKYKPDFKQKGVDMKVGLDMALMGMKHLVDKIVLVAGDSDFITPIKFVRKEGLLVYLYSMGHKVKSKLKEHCDYILT